MNINKSNILIILIIIFGFGMRLYAANNVPLTEDELSKLTVVKSIHFSKESLSLPMGDPVTHNPLLLPYLMKLSTLLLGITPLGLRMPNIILGTLTILIIYLLVKKNIDLSTAVLTAILMCFSQYCISSSRLAWEPGIILFFGACAIFLTQEFVSTQKSILFYLLSISLALGIAVKGTMFLILPSLLFYIYIYSKGSLTQRKIFFLIIINFIILLPNILWNINHNFVNVSHYSQKADFPALNIGPVILYFGELIVLNLQNIPDSKLDLMLSPEHPFMFWVTGLIAICGIPFTLTYKRTPFINLLLMIFGSIFLFLFFFRPQSGSGEPFHLDNFWWATITILPSIILGSVMLTRIYNKYHLSRYAMFVLLGIIIFNTYNFISFPANYFLPRNHLRVRALNKTVRDYMSEGKTTSAKKVRKYIQNKYPKKTFNISTINSSSTKK